MRWPSPSSVHAKLRKVGSMMTTKVNQAGGFIPWAAAVYARAEARRRGNRRIGTEDLVLGLLRERDVPDVGRG